MRLAPLSRARIAGALAGALAGAASPATAQTPSPTRPRTTYEDLQMFTGVLNQLRTNHPDSLDTHDLIMAAIRGLVQAADPHSHVIVYQPLSAEKAKAMREGKLHPVGITFRFEGASPVVVGLAPGSSAAKADILPGDELVAVDGKPVAAEGPDELDILLAGEKNSVVRLTLERRRIDGSLARLERAVKREKLGEETAVPVAVMLDAETGYARITTFANQKAADDLHAAIERLEKQGMKRLVLDLRDNGGGSVREAAQVAGEFLPKGAVVYTQAGRKKEVTDTGRVERSFWRSERRYPIAVLINDGTASASELVAGALQDHDRATIVGRPSFGKSLVMYPFPLPDGSLVFMVAGHVKTPCGRVIQRQYRGITAREYYRRARAERDTLDRPSCKTAAGRTVYGGGGIYPDVRLPEREPPPLWLARLREESLPLQWAGGWIGANGASLTSADALAASPTLPAAALADFRRFAAGQGVPVPDGPDADRLLERQLVLTLAGVKWGDSGAYRVLAAVDPEVRKAVEALK